MGEMMNLVEILEFVKKIPSRAVKDIIFRYTSKGTIKVPCANIEVNPVPSLLVLSQCPELRGQIGSFLESRVISVDLTVTIAVAAHTFVQSFDPNGGFLDLPVCSIAINGESQFVFTLTEGGRIHTNVQRWWKSDFSDSKFWAKYHSSFLAATVEYERQIQMVQTVVYDLTPMDDYHRLTASDLVLDVILDELLSLHRIRSTKFRVISSNRPEPYRSHLIEVRSIDETIRLVAIDEQKQIETTDSTIGIDRPIHVDSKDENVAVVLSTIHESLKLHYVRSHLFPSATAQQPQPTSAQAHQPLQGPTNYFSGDPQDLYNRSKMPFLIHATETLLNSSGLLQTIYFTVPFCTSHGLGQELQRILNDPKCQAPNNIGVMLPPDQGTNGLTAVLEMICQWAELFRVPFVMINLTGGLETRKVVMELSIARHGSVCARVVLVDNNRYDLTARAVATTILSLCKKSAYHSSAGGGVQRPSLKK